MILPLQTVDVSPRGVDPWLEAAAWAVLVAIIVASIALLAILRNRIYDAEQQRQLSSLRASEMRADPPTIPVRRGFDADQLRQDLLRVWKKGGPPRVRSVRGAIRELRAGLAASIPTAPPIVRNGIIEGMAIAVLGIAMMVPIRWINAAGDPVGTIAILQTHFGDVTPGVGPLETVLQYGVSAVLLTGVLFWQVWLLISILLVLGGIALLQLRSMRDDRWVGVATAAYGGLVAIGAVILVAKIGQAILEGYLMAWLRAWFPVGFVVTLMILGGGGWLLLRLLPGAFDELAAAIQTVGRSIALRGVLLSRGLSYAIVLLTALFLLAWIPTPDLWVRRISGVPMLTWPGVRYLVVIVVAAIVAGLLSRAAAWMWSQVKYRGVDPRSVRSEGITEVHLRPYELQDADGRKLFACRVDDRRLVHRTPDQLLDDVVDAVQGMHEAGHRRALTFSDYYGDRIDSGIVDETEVRKSLRGELKADIKSTIARGSGNPPKVDVGAVDNRLERRYPPDAIREVLADLHHRGEVSQLGGAYVYFGAER